MKRTTSVPPERYHAYREAIVKFRYWLRETDNVSNVEAFKRHLEWKQSYLAPDRFAVRREALRWYYQEGRKRMMEEKGASLAKAESGDKRLFTEQYQMYARLFRGLARG